MIVMFIPVQYRGLPSSGLLFPAFLRSFRGFATGLLLAHHAGLLILLTPFVDTPSVSRLVLYLVHT
jgi:hypothetical protein